MKQLFTRIRFADCLVAAILVGVPFHGFLTVWGSSLVGHYTLLRSWDDILLAVLVLIAAWWLVKDADARKWLAGSLLVRLVAAYAALSVLLGCIAWAKGDVTPWALGFGLLLNLRFMVWFLAVLLVVRRSPWLRRRWPGLLLVPATLVVVFAAAQYVVLPHDFLAHFGYNAATNIAPIETINHNPQYIRVQSTLRGANPLGAYLVVVVTALGVLFARGRRRAVCAVFGAVALLALFATGSRSAWIGAAASLSVVTWLCVRTRRIRLWLAAGGAAVVLAGLGTFVLLRHNVALQNQLLHTQDRSAVTVNSNDAHASAFSTGLKDVIRQPFGDGPGTAGPASTHNTGHPGRLAENYYLQIAQETGWLGLALLLCIFALVARELYQRIPRSRLALMLLASLIGVSIVNLLSHAWTDDTLAFVWWGLAAIALADMPKSREL